MNHTTGTAPNGTREWRQSPLLAIVPDLPGDLSAFRFTDWQEAWTDEPGDIQWIYAPVLEEASANVIYSDAGVGKSLISIELAASIAQTDNVLYVDGENSRRQHRDRLRDMGYSPERLSRLHMLSFPELPPLDSAEGGNVLLRLAQMKQARLVIIDTMMRFVDGKEDSADTFNAVWRRTMLPLKAAGIASLRLDHEGKDGSRGQRGSSAKRGDVDTVWRLTWPQRGASRYLENQKDRSSHCPEKIRLDLFTSPTFGHAWHWDRSYAEAGPVFRGTAGNSDPGTLAEHGITPDMTVRRSAEILRSKGVKMSNPRITQALREMRSVPGTAGNSGEHGT